MKQQYFRITLFAALMATLAIGCQKEEGTVTLGAEIQKPADSKMYIDDHTPCWHNGDEVHINSDDYPVMAATGSSARIEDVVSASAYRAIFPARIVAENADISSMSSFPVTLPSTQLYELVGSHQLVDVPMGAYLTSGSTLQFHNLCSVVRVIVSNSLNRELPLRSIELQAQSAKLSGTGTATVSGQQADCITLSGSGQNRVSLVFDNDCPATVEARGTSTFDIVVPAFTTDDVTITAYTADGYMSTVTKEDVALVHNTITTVTLNVTALAEAPHAELVTGSAFNAAIPAEATSVVFEYNSSVTSGTLLSTANSPVPIYGNLDGTVWRISTSDSLINANPNCARMFMSWGNYPTAIIDFGNGFNTANVTRMDSMFYECHYLTNLNLSSFNTSNVTNMSWMFYNCNNLTSLDLSNFNTSNVTDMSDMFAGCSRLTRLDLSSFNTANVTDMTGMFCHLYSMTSLNLSSFNTSNVTDMHSMFLNCTELSNINLSNFNTSNVTNMYCMFYHCNHLSSLDLSSFNTTNVVTMNSMFSGCNNMTSLNLSNFDTHEVTDMRYMFENCSNLTRLNLSNFDMSLVTEKSLMCYGLSTTSGHCTITCPSVVQTALQIGTSLPTTGVNFTWLRP